MRRIALAMVMLAGCGPYVGDWAQNSATGKRAFVIARTTQGSMFVVKDCDGKVELWAYSEAEPLPQQAEASHENGE